MQSDVSRTARYIKGGEIIVDDKGLIMPYSQLAEQSVLGALIKNKDVLPSAAQLISGEDFYIPAHKEIYESVMLLFAENTPIDVITLSEKLKLRGTFDKIGGVAYLVELVESVPTAANFKYYANIVAEKALLRRLINASEDISKASYAGEEEVSAILDLAEQKVFEILEKRKLQGFTKINEVLSINYEHLNRLADGKESIIGIPTGFSALDKILGGLHNGNLIIVAARPAMGKTSFALNIATNAARKSKLPIAVFSLEMSKEELTNRIWSGESLVDLYNLQRGELRDEEWVMLADGMDSLNEVPIYIDDGGGTSVTDMRSKCRRLKREKGLGLIIIDHMQLMQGTRRNENRQQEISDISRMMKLMAKDLGVPVVVLSQLSRGVESRTEKRPVLSDLRESGAIEQDADVVMLLYREDYYNKEAEKPGVAEVIIAKHRNGATGMVELKWQPEYTKFVTLDKQYTEI
jgi:replicative DNA helicase